MKAVVEYYRFLYSYAQNGCTIASVFAFWQGEAGRERRGGENVEKAKETNVKAELNSQEWQLIEMIRNLEYGQLTITVRSSKPIHVEEVRKSIPLK